MVQAPKWAAISFLVGLLCFYGSKRVTTITLAQSTIKVQPFVFQTETYSYEKDANGKLIHKKTVARQSDGSTATLASVGLVEWGATTRKITLPDGTWTTIYDLIDAKTTWSMDSAELASLKERLRNPPERCVFQTEGDPKWLREETLFGRQVDVIEAVTTAARKTSWRARDLSCEDLEYRYESAMPDGSFRLRSEERLISLTFGDPPHSYFDIASSLTEMKPSDAHFKFFAKLGIPEDEKTKRVSEQVDQKYLSGKH